MFKSWGKKKITNFIATPDVKLYRFFASQKYNVMLKLHIFTLLYQTKRAGSLTKFKIIAK